MTAGLPGPPKKIDTGRDFNFFQEVNVVNGVFTETPQVVIKFKWNQNLYLTITDGTIVEFSFNGNTVHGKLDASNNTAQMFFPNRSNKKIWFRSADTTSVVQVEAYNPV